MDSKKINIIIILLTIGTIIAAYWSIQFFSKSDEDIIRDSMVDNMIDDRVDDEPSYESNKEEAENLMPEQNQSDAESDTSTEKSSPSDETEEATQTNPTENLKASIEIITNRFIQIESRIYDAEENSWFDDNLEMNVKSYGRGMDLYKIQANDRDMNFEIYYWENEVIFILAVPTENIGERNDKGQPIGYRMYFTDGEMIASTDLDFNPVNPSSQDFITMEDFTLRLAYYFYLSHVE